MQKITLTVAALWLQSTFAGGALAAESVYTELPSDGAGCVAVDPGQAAADGEGGSVSQYCPGYKKYQVLYKEGDARVSIHYGFLSQRIVDRAWESFGPFNHAGDKIEWRLDGKRQPYAAIQRYFIDNINEATGMGDDAHRGQVLVISKVGQPGVKEGCVAGLVDALQNADANVLARDVADRLAASFRCGIDRPAYHGKRGDKAPEPSISLGQD
jgi:hypothetical protein